MTEAEETLYYFKNMLEGRIEAHTDVGREKLSRYWLGRLDALSAVYSDLEQAEKDAKR